jgi:hypothetical protein
MRRSGPKGEVAREFFSQTATRRNQRRVVSSFLLPHEHPQPRLSPILRIQFPFPHGSKLVLQSHRARAGDSAAGVDLPQARSAAGDNRESFLRTSASTESRISICSVVRSIVGRCSELTIFSEWRDDLRVVCFDCKLTTRRSSLHRTERLHFKFVRSSLVRSNSTLDEQGAAQFPADVRDA